jgi:hypothetical protein
MKKKACVNKNIYKGMALIADPIHSYAFFTVPDGNGTNLDYVQCDACNLDSYLNCDECLI